MKRLYAYLLLIFTLFIFINETKGKANQSLLKFWLLLFGLSCSFMFEQEAKAQLNCTNPTTAAIGISASATICEGDANPAFSVTGCDPEQCLSTCVVDASCDITVNIVVDHTWVGDLDEWHLIGPGGVDLGNLLGGGNPSGSGNPNFDYTFTTTSTTPFPNGGQPNSGTFEIPAGVLAAIIGQDINAPGWGAQIYDCVGADSGYIVSADIDIDCSGAGCTAGEDVASYSLTGSPATTAISDGTCNAATAAIVVVPPADLAEPFWYDAAAAGTMVGTGTGFTSPETAPGTYSYFVQCACDLSDCPAARPQVDLTIVDVPAISATVDDCAGGPDTGTIDITEDAAPVNGMWEYSIDGGVTWTTTPNFTGLANGSYTPMIRNTLDNTCMVTGTAINIDCQFVGCTDPCFVDYDPLVTPPGDVSFCVTPVSATTPCDDGDPCTENDTEIIGEDGTTVCTPCAGMVVAPPDPTFSVAPNPIPLCGGAAAITATTPGGTFTGSGASLVVGTNIDPLLGNAGVTYTLTYTVSTPGGCMDSSTITFSIVNDCDANGGQF